LKDAQGRNYSNYDGLCLEQDLERTPVLKPGAVIAAQFGLEVLTQANGFDLTIKEPGSEKMNFIFVNLLTSEASVSPAIMTTVPTSTPMSDAILR
jgi:hypothetical protein